MSEEMQTWTSAPNGGRGQGVAMIALLALGIGVPCVYFFLQRASSARQAAANLIPIQNVASAGEEKAAPQVTSAAVVTEAVTPAIAVPSTVWSEDFSADALNAERWVITSKNDFKEKSVDIVKGGESNRLRLRAGTIGTDDKTVKFLGVRSVERFSLEPGTKVSFDLDWNNQANGSYLSAGIVLCPTATTASSLDEPDWLKVEYFGVPPGKNGRVVIGSRSGGREQQVYTEGWPEVRREGRAIGREHVEIAFENSEVNFSENGKLMYSYKALPKKAYIYLQMSSHSNYPTRELFFDRVKVEAIGPKSN